MSLDMYEMFLDDKIVFVELLADRSTTCMDLTGTGYHFVEEVFSLYRALTCSLVVNLKTLGIVCLIKGPVDLKFVCEINSIFYRTLDKMKCLTSLTMKGLGDYEMMSVIGRTCHHLEHLDVSQSLRLNNECLAALVTTKPGALLLLWSGQKDRFIAKCTPCCQKLVYLGITGTEITTQAVCSMLQLLPNVRSLGGYLHHASMCSAVTFLYGENGPSYRETILKLDVYDVVKKSGLVQVCASYEYVNEADTGEAADNGSEAADNSSDAANHGSDAISETVISSEDEDSESDLIPIPDFLRLTCIWDLVITEKQCRILKRVCPNVVEFDTSLNALDILHEFNPLRALCVECDFKPWVNTLSWYLESKGSPLESLLIRDPIGGFIPIDRVRDCCPKLKSVTLPLEVFETVSDAPQPWSSLLHANIVVPSRRSFVQLCSIAVNLTDIYVSFSPEPYTESVHHFNDKFIIDILKSGGLATLRNICVGKCFFGGAALQSFLQHCRQLRSVGYLDLWWELTDCQLDSAKAVVRDNNWDLKFVSSTLSQCQGNEKKMHFKSYNYCT